MIPTIPTALLETLLEADGGRWMMDDDTVSVAEVQGRDPASGRRGGDRAVPTAGACRAPPARRQLPCRVCPAAGMEVGGRTVVARGQGPW